MRKSKFVIESDALPAKGRKLLEKSLVGSAFGDAPLLVEVLLVDEEEIRRLNREQRNTDRVTDVLSFPSMDGIKGLPLLREEHPEELDEKGRLFLGSVVLCEKRAQEQAEEYGHSFERELYYLTVHGCMHCLGYDHERDEERAEMREREEFVLKKMKLTRD